jgi:pyridine nucleotide-disulfide oxidoreductase family protein
MNPLQRNMLLVGGGHAHVHILKQLQNVNWPDIRVILISPDRFQYYSGMFSGYIEGHYKLDEIRIDLLKLCESAGIQFIQDDLESVFTDAQYALTGSGERINYDLISFNIGSYTSNKDVPGAAKHAIRIKPNHQIQQIKDVINSKGSIVIAGGGASGVELSLSIQSNIHQKGNGQRVILVSSENLMKKKGGLVPLKFKKLIERKGIQLIEHDSITHVDTNKLTLKSGKTLDYGKLLWLTGPSAPSLFGNSKLAVDHYGYLKVNHLLQSVSQSNVFGEGDCVSFAAHPDIDKAGVFAVRAAPILWNNICGYLFGSEMRNYVPQSAYLSILSTGNREAMLLYKGFSFHGKWCWRLKRFIDLSFIQKYQ